MDKMIDMGVMTEKVGNVVKAAVGELEAKRKIPSAIGKAGRGDSIKERAFRLFDGGKRLGDPEVKAMLDLAAPKGFRVAVDFDIN